MDADRYLLRCLTRGRIGNLRFTPGAVLTLEGERALRVAAHLVRTRSARPADEGTKREIELYQLLQRALPQP